MRAYVLACCLTTVLACSAGGSNGMPFFGDAGPATSAPDGGPSNAPVDACGRYLSCLLATSPEAYGAAIQVYGDDTACWKSPQQAEGCTKACSSAFEKIAVGCECNGSDCTKCEDVPYGTYTSRMPGRTMKCNTPGPPVYADDVQLRFSKKSADNISAELFVGGDHAELEGKVSCKGSFSVTGGDASTWDAKITRSDEETLAVALTTTRTTFNGQMLTCSLSVTIAR
jgi:hypothetical protein